MEASRPAFSNVPESLQSVFYILAALTIILFLLGMWTRISLWLRGKDEDSEVLTGVGITGLIKLSLVNLFSMDCFFARRVFKRSKLRGIMLILIVWSFIILFIGTVLVSLDHYLRLNFLRGTTYLAFSLILDLAGGFLLLGTAAALLRRYVFKPERMVGSLEDGVILMLLFLTVLSGFTVEGLRLAVTKPLSNDWSPVGAIFTEFGKMVLGTNQAALSSSYITAWILHFLFAFSFIVYIPYSKQFHMFAAQITTLAAAERSKVS